MVTKSSLGSWEVSSEYSHTDGSLDRRRVDGVTLSALYYVVRDSVRHQFTPSLGVTLLGVLRKRGHVKHVSQHTVYTLGTVLVPQHVPALPDICVSLKQGFRTAQPQVW